MTRSVSNSKSLPLTPSTSTSTEWKPDLFAQKFVPVALHNINSAQVFFPVHCPSPAYINFEEYAQSFLPKPLYHACASSRILSSIRDPRYAMDTPILGPQIPPQQMNNRNYAVRFRNLLVEERKSLALDFKQYNLFEIPLHPLGHNVYRIDVPGLREDNTPARFVGDSLSVRAIRAKFSTYGTIKYFDGTEYIAYISAIDRLNEYIIVRLPLRAIDDLSYGLPIGFNVQFTPRNAVETYQMMASDIFAQRLASDEWSQQILFPEKSHAIWLPKKELSRPSSLNWIDKDLNYEQQKAVDAIVSSSFGAMPFLISGPPGTGKTKTIIETILQLLSQPSLSSSDIHILACAPSPSAADTIALRLIKHLKPGEMFRLNDITRTFAEVPDALMLYSHSTETFFSLPPWEKLMMAKVVVTDCMSSFELIKARCTNRDISPLQDLYRPIFPDQKGSVLKHWHWTHLFIDEAAQAREPESLIPLLVVAPESLSNDSIMPKLILAGDSNQLGPNIVSVVARRYGLDISLFERLLKRDVYADHPNARQNIWKHFEGRWYRPAFVNLIRNYRSHKGILMMPSAMFYNSTLLDEARNTTSLTSWKYLTNPKIPVLFVPCADEEMWIPDTAGWYNPSEIKITVTLIQHLLDKENTPETQVQAAEVAVITPFREQVIRTRKALRKQGLGAVSVGTVENYQGGERRVTILNCVRSTARFLDWDKQKGRGIVNQRRRFNVAITRAKDLLIIIGNPSILQMDPYWRGYLSFIKRNNLSKESFTFDEDKSNQWMSSLEKGMRIRDEVLNSAKALGDGVGGWKSDIYGEEGMLHVGRILEDLVLEGDDWDGDVENGADHAEEMES